MGLIDKLRKAGGILKDRAASAVSALKGVTIGGARTRGGIRIAARATRLTSPLGIGLTAVSFAPEIVRGVKAAGRFLQRAVPRGVAFVGGQRVVSGVVGGAGAGAVAAVVSRKNGVPARPSDFGDPSLQSRPRAVPRKTTTRRVTTNGRRTTKARKRKAPTRRKVTRKRRVTRKRKRRTHRSPRHKGHKRVSFTTKDGRKVSFLSNPKARHR